MDRLKRLQDLESDLMAAEAEIERLQAHNLKLTDANVRLSDKVLRLRAKLEQIDNHITNRVRDKDAEIERLRHEIDVQCSSEYVERILKENERLRAALAKSCEEGRDEMYDCGYNRLRAALERIANPRDGEGYGEDLREMAREALKDDL
jgi:predicted RNase H-like nuclease (RuvC/YqgF family)